MEFVILGFMCFIKAEIGVPACLPFEQQPIVYYQTRERCEKEANRLKVELKKSFENDGFEILEFDVQCIEKKTNKTMT